eukprot:365530-Chlamydomonas_euryale.AAC.23
MLVALQCRWLAGGAQIPPTRSPVPNRTATYREGRCIGDSGGCGWRSAAPWVKYVRRGHEPGARAELPLEQRRAPLLAGAAASFMQMQRVICTNLSKDSASSVMTLRSWGGRAGSAASLGLTQYDVEEVIDHCGGACKLLVTCVGCGTAVMQQLCTRCMAGPTHAAVKQQTGAAMRCCMACDCLLVRPAAWLKTQRWHCMVLTTCMTMACLAPSHACHVCSLLDYLLVLRADRAGSQEEVEALYRRFRTLDRGRKGYLSSDEFMAIPELSINPVAQRLVRDSQSLWADWSTCWRATGCMFHKEQQQVAARLGTDRNGSAVSENDMATMQLLRPLLRA